MNKIYWSVNDWGLVALCGWNQTIFHWLRWDLHQYRICFPKLSMLHIRGGHIIRGDDYG
jgi:hypothetical protein